MSSLTKVYSTNKSSIWEFWSSSFVRGTLVNCYTVVRVPSINKSIFHKKVQESDNLGPLVLCVLHTSVCAHAVTDHGLSRAGLGITSLLSWGTPHSPWESVTLNRPLQMEWRENIEGGKEKGGQVAEFSPGF